VLIIPFINTSAICIDVVKMAAHCSVKQIATVAEFKQHISDLPTGCLAVIYFHASWASPCIEMSRHLETTATEISATNSSQISFLALEAEELADISEEYRVSQVPCLILQRDNKVLDKVMGTNTDTVNTAINTHLGQQVLGDASHPSLPPRQQVTRPPASANSGQAASAGIANGSSTIDETKEKSKDDLNARLDQLVKAAPVMLFMKGTPSAPQCGFSRKTVAILRENGVKYGFFNILADDEVRQGLKEFSDWPTFPQVYVEGELIGGLDIVCISAAIT
jgi:Grx4 family monothiol glutaredoxin